MTTLSPRYGRSLEDFEVGATYAHPWDVTVDAGTIAMFQASFLDATPTYASAAVARGLGLLDRPIHPLLLLNLGLSFSVHDVSEQAIAHLAYLDVRFPNAAYAGDTVTAQSRVLEVKPTSSGDKGVVAVRTTLFRQDGAPLCDFERRALVRARGELSESRAQAEVARLGRIASPAVTLHAAPERVERLPESLRALPPPPSRPAGFAGFFEQLSVEQVFAHYVGKTVGESEHMQLTSLLRNTHPLHFDEHYCREGHSFAGTRVVYGGLVFAWVASLASRDVAGQVGWDMGFDDGAHPAGVVAGDTLYAATKILAKRELNAHWGEVQMRLVGVKNVRPEEVIASGNDLFTAELGKGKDAKIKEKVFEITRTVLVRRESLCP